MVEQSNGILRSIAALWLLAIGTKNDESFIQVKAPTAVDGCSRLTIC